MGSDVDLLVVVHHSDVPVQRRPLEWETLTLPVPADLLVYAQREWDLLEGRFRDTLDREAVWVYGNRWLRRSSFGRSGTGFVVASAIDWPTPGLSVRAGIAGS